MKLGRENLWLWLVISLLHAVASPVASGAEENDPLSDTFRWLIPASGLAATIGLQDWEGSKQWGYSIGVGQITTEVLKKAVGEHRPNGSSSTSSFPSGHVSGAFSGAAFLQQRYGWSYALPAYIGASYTGWSRVDLGRHYPHDVYAGAAIGILSSYLFTTPYDDDIDIGLFYEQETIGLQINWKW